MIKVAVSDRGKYFKITEDENRSMSAVCRDGIVRLTVDTGRINLLTFEWANHHHRNALERSVPAPWGDA